MITSPLPSNKKVTQKINYGIVIVCEDTNSNYTYLQKKIKSRIPNTIDTVFLNTVFLDSYGNQILTQNSSHVGHTDPYNITIHGINTIDAKNKEYQNGNPNTPLFFRELYCVVDVDDNISNGTLARAYAQIYIAQANSQIQYRMICSNECFEIWYILHFHDIIFPIYRGTNTQKNRGIINSNGSNQIEKILKKAISWQQIPAHKKPNTKKNKIKSFEYFFEIMQSEGNEKQAIERAILLLNNSIKTCPSDNPSTELHILIEKINTF